MLQILTQLITWYVHCRSVRPIDAIYGILREMADPDMVRFDDARQRILAKGYTPNQFDECLDEYERLNVWHINQSRTRITFVWTLNSLSL